MSVPVTSFTRLPETGPLDIKNYTQFLEASKVIFEERWTKFITYKDNLKDFDIVKLLGNGSFGSVVLVKYHKNDKYYAMKIIVKEQIAKSKQVEYLKNEKKVLQCTNFPFMVYLHCCFHDNCFVYLVMPYVACELYDLLKHLKKFSETQARFYVSQVVLAIEYLHYLDLIYRDLKPENILLDETGYIKLTDFGFCKRMMSRRTFTMCGTPEYIAPEVLHNNGYGFAVDWWGCGILVYELVAGTTPFHGRTTVKTCSNVLSGKYKVPSHFSSELKDLIGNLLTPDLTKRFGNLRDGTNEIKGHKWFRTINWMSIINRTASVPCPPPYPFKRKELDLGKSVLRMTAFVDGHKCKYSDQFEDF